MDENEDKKNEDEKNADVQTTKNTAEGGKAGVEEGRVTEISGAEDGRVSPYFRLTDAQLRARQRPGEAIFIAEGPKVVTTALERGLEPVSFLIRRKMIDGAGKDILAMSPETPVYTADDSLLEEITGFRLQRSWVLCAMKRPREKQPGEVLAGARRAAVLEGVWEPSNVGAIFRSAAALGWDAILLSPDCSDPWHRRSVRVCMGAVFTVPFARTAEDSGQELLHRLGFKTCGMALREGSLPLDSGVLKAQERLAVYLGNEDRGLRDETLDRCDYIVRIPMARGIDSLNVAAAAAISFWELKDHL